ncbi:MAG TPA: LysM peptidoglycan-binding domain-containing protein [Allosphingosinicella sp.]|nr:LysM peptidoglycan-binding domain-containing protein [Allosphingosinicella sp.]
MTGLSFRAQLFGPASLAAVLALALAGCGTVQRARAPAGAAPSPSGNWAEQVRDVIADLNRGDAAAARRKLSGILRRQPDNSIARHLLSQIDTDPRALLGTQSYSYTLRQGETLSTVAGRTLGNPMLFYALARYNDIAVPSSVMPGQTIQIPGRRPAPPPTSAPARPEPRAPARPPRATPPQTLAPAPRPAPSRGNPAQAARLRAQGLAALNAGAVDRAVALLRRAAALDPGNAAIRNDLGRAQRIQSTVRSRR